MRKSIMIAVAIFALGMAYQAFHAIIRSAKGDHIAFYPRFQKENGEGKTSFNWWGLLSPFQIESQKKVYDTLRFSEKVVYPIAHTFELVAPRDTMAEVYVANKLGKVILDSIDKIKFRLKFDYDNQSLGVRRAASPNTLKLQSPKVMLSLYGTASPEAAKYGYEESMIPGRLEQENAELAKARLERTGALLQKNLSLLKIDSVKVLSMKSEELQFRTNIQVTQAILDSSILDNMRFVRADVAIPYEKLEVTPVTSPIGVPILFGSLAGLVLLLGLLKWRREKKTVEPKEKSKYSWNWLWEVLKWIGIATVVAVALYLLHLIPIEPFIWILFWLLVLFSVLVLCYMIYLLLRSTREQWREFWKAIWEAILAFLKALWRIVEILWALLVFIFWMVVFLIDALFILIGYLLDKFWKWWEGRCSCCKIMILVNLALVTFIMIHFIVKH